VVDIVDVEVLVRFFDVSDTAEVCAVGVEGDLSAEFRQNVLEGETRLEAETWKRQRTLAGFERIGELDESGCVERALKLAESDTFVRENDHHRDFNSCVRHLDDLVTVDLGVRETCDSGWFIICTSVVPPSSSSNPSSEVASSGKLWDQFALR